MSLSKFNILDTYEKLENIDSYMVTSEGESKHKYIAFDTETNGLHLHKTIIIGISFSANRKTGFYIPFLKWEPDTSYEKETKALGKHYPNGNFKCIWSGKIYPENITPKDYAIPEKIKNYIERWFKPAKLLMHNAPFDINHLFVNTGIDLKDSLFVDTSLLSHCVDENIKTALKEVTEAWRHELGYDPYKATNLEQLELGTTVIKNGGVFRPKTKHIWRGDYLKVGKYAISDVFMTYGVFEVGLKKFIKDYGKEKLTWFFKEEVMPVCREIVIPMKREGVYIDVPYFQEMQPKLVKFQEKLEDRIISKINQHLKDFEKGKSIEEAVSDRKLINKLIELENLKYPEKFDKKTNTYKKSLAKAEVKKAYNDNPHWVYGYILGEDEIRYSEEKLMAIKLELYRKELGRRYRFNISSRDHLKWLFCEKLGYSKTELPQTKTATATNPIPKMTAEVFQEYFLKKHDWVKYLILWHKLNKLRSSYVEPAINLNVDGWLYMDFRQNGTISGRFSCSGGFNLQTLPKVEDMPTKCEKCNSDIELKSLIELVKGYKCKKCGLVKDTILDSSAIKKGFIAPKGYKIINADFSALEIRIFSFSSGDERLKVIHRDNLDFYSKIYCDLNNEEYRDLRETGEKDKRQKIKAVPLGITYGSRGPQVANMLDYKVMARRKNKKTGKYETREVLDVDRGWETRREFLEAYPDLKKFMDKCDLDCISQGWVQTLIGRKRHFIYAPYIYRLISKYNISIDDFLDMKKSILKEVNTQYGLNSKDLEAFCNHFKLDYDTIVKDKDGWLYVKHQFKNEINNSKNYTIQGLAAHVTNRAMLETNRIFKKEKLDARVVLQVHDEITCYASEQDASRAAEILKHCMENNKYAKMIDIPMEANPIICNNLKESK